jgi:hypothetical protein
MTMPGRSVGPAIQSEARNAGMWLMAESWTHNVALTSDVCYKNCCCRHSTNSKSIVTQSRDVSVHNDRPICKLHYAKALRHKLWAVVQGDLPDDGGNKNL